MKNAISIIRTAVPVLAGCLITWLAYLPKVNLIIPLMVAAIATVFWYTGVKILGWWWPWFEVLNGWASVPFYDRLIDKLEDKVNEHRRQQ